MSTSMICEQGDLGLWQTELNDKDQKAYNEATNKDNRYSRTQSINEKEEPKKK